MRTHQQVFLWLGISILGALTLSPASMGQASRDSAAAAPAIDDWSYHHVVFSKPATAEQAMRVEQDPRYWQQIRRQSPSAPEAEISPVLAPELQRHTHGASNNVGLWSEDLGTGATMGALNYPAKYSLTTTTASCGSDFVVYPTGLAGSATQASIVAYSNLYSGCGGTVPSVYWAYYIGDGNTIQSSPVFSLDGTQLAFVQEEAGEAVFVLLKWVPSATEAVASPDPVGRHGPYTSCHAPCRAELHLNDAGVFPSDTNSSIFVDYPSDTAFVGDDSGYLHKFNPVFNGPPAEVGGVWPVQVNPGAPTALTSPVYDSVSGNVYVADAGGFLYAVNSLTAAVTQSAGLDYSVAFDTPAGPGIVDGPILDFTAELVYVFATSDGSGLCTGGADCSAVYQVPASFGAGDTGLEAVVGNSSIEPTAPEPMFIGGFDSSYKNSANATGHLYVCGNTGGPPAIYQVAIQGGVLGTVNAGPVLSSTTTPCSPVTDVMNANVPAASGGATEWIFASAGTGGMSTACASGGCIFNFKDTPWLPTHGYAVGQEILDSNFHIEFVVASTGASGMSAPFWSITTGGSTTDGAIQWLDLGPSSAVAPAAWVKTHHYPKGSEILDPNGNIELVTSSTGDISGGTIPTFNPVVGGTTTDGTVTWTNVGPPPTAALAVTGGASGIIVDNTVATGTQAGASQVYFTTLGNQTCTTSGGTGGCAVQASQSALK
ncbi:MAG: hypothetical protein WAK89_04915 [Candidatus Sulfotelmatobacter sp.]